jgi:hypothetical protein
MEEAAKISKKRNKRRHVLSLAAILLALPMYFVRELFAAEILFGIAFVVLLAVCGVCYLVGALGEQAFRLAEAAARRLLISGLADARFAHRGHAFAANVAEQRNVR